MIQQIVATYLKRFTVASRYLAVPPKSDTVLIIVIPAYKEPDLLTTLQSLGACQRPSGAVEVIITINAPEDSPEKILAINSNCIRQIEGWIQTEQPDFITTHIIREESILKKDAGAGMARKIGMDEAVQRWGMLTVDGPIICLDADCTVSSNYLVEGEKVFQDTTIKVGHFHFEHEFEKENDPVLQQGIIHYELHLRCYVEGLRQAGYPNAIHTVGSCMVVRASSYAKSGGMNRRKAGEDFYFLHKLISLGGWRYISATVYPSCRVSDRVPFGTGRAQLEWKERTENSFTYNTKMYSAMRMFFHSIPQWYESDVVLTKFPISITEFLTEQNIVDRVGEFRRQSNSQAAFAKRFWQWMDGFMVLKLTHYLRDHGYPNEPTSHVAAELLAVKGGATKGGVELLLKKIRQLG